MTNCWICGDPADSREHRFKASDIRLHIGELTQAKPLFRAPDGSKPLRIGSENAKAFKFSKSICQKCNNQRTQPYDRAWETLSKYFFDNRDQIVAKQRWEPRRVFPGAARKSLLNVHLYFVKFFGCVAHENSAPIDLKPLSQNLLKGKPNHRFFLSFGASPVESQKDRYALEMPINVGQRTGSEQDPNCHDVLHYWPDCSRNILSSGGAK